LSAGLIHARQFFINDLFKCCRRLCSRKKDSINKKARSSKYVRAKSVLNVLFDLRFVFC